jgi:hypothetical protein
VGPTTRLEPDLHVFCKGRNLTWLWRGKLIQAFDIALQSTPEESSGF